MAKNDKSHDTIRRKARKQTTGNDGGCWTNQGYPGLCIGCGPSLHSYIFGQCRTRLCGVCRGPADEATPTQPPCTLHIWRSTTGTTVYLEAKGEKLARQQQQSAQRSHKPTQDTPAHHLVHFSVLVVKHKWGLDHISAWWLYMSPHFFADANTHLSTEPPTQKKPESSLSWYKNNLGWMHTILNHKTTDTPGINNLKWPHTMVSGELCLTDLWNNIKPVPKHMQPAFWHLHPVGVRRPVATERIVHDFKSLVVLEFFFWNILQL